MSTVPPAPRRHALNMPAGSVRAILALGVLGFLWLLVLLPIDPARTAMRQQVSLSFIYLQFLMVLILGHFFTAHGHSIGAKVSGASPLGLPTGTVRLLLLAGYLGLAVYMYFTNWQFELPQTGRIAIWLLVMVSAFFLGHVITGIMRSMFGEYLPPWYQDLQAWVAMLAMLLLGVVLLVRLVINPGLPDEAQLTLDYTEAILAGLVGLYFGSRS